MSLLPFVDAKGLSVSDPWLTAVVVEERTALQERITANGGGYSGELNRKCTHLIASKPEGQKYLAARKWGLKIVSIEWLDQTIERGMVLDEQFFDPVLPPEERGKGARDDPELALGKRQRLLDSFADPDAPKRKLRKTASMKLSSQRETVWGDILAKRASAPEAAEATPQDEEAPNPVADGDAPLPAKSAPEDEGIFSASSFYIQDFESRKHDRLAQIISGHGGRVCQTPKDLYLTRAPHRFTLVPQDSHSTPAPPPPDSPAAPTVTELFIERCLQDKKLHRPQDHVLGRPFPVHPIRGFEGLEINSAGFLGIDLLHLERAVRQLGARYEETIRRRTTSLLVCRELKLVRKEKLRLALDGGIPVVGEKWLWDCIEAGEKLGFESYMFPELKQRVPKARSSEEGNAQVRRGFGPDESAFTGGSSGSRKGSAGFHTARTHIFENLDGFSGAKPLKEVASNAAPRMSTAPDDELPPTAKAADGSTAGSREKGTSTSTSSRASSFKGSRREDTRGQDEDEARVGEREEAKRDEAARKERELLALSTKLTSLTDAPEPDGPRKRRRGILGRAASNVSAPGSVDTRAVRGDGWDGEVEGAEEVSSLTQVGYFDPEAAEARERVLGGLERRVKTR